MNSDIKIFSLMMAVVVERCVGCREERQPQAMEHNQSDEVVLVKSSKECWIVVGAVLRVKENWDEKRWFRHSMLKVAAFGK